MSQSDYMQYKKTSIELQEQSKSENVDKLPPIFNSSQYTLFKKYALENTIVNTKESLLRLQTVGTQNVLNMEKQYTNDCPHFIVCNNTTDRPNVKPVLNRPFSTSIYPSIMPSYNLAQKSKPNQLILRNPPKCKCELQFT